MPESDLVDEAWRALAGAAGDPAPHLTIEGDGAGLPARLRVADTAVASVGVALMAAAALPRTAPAIGVDRAQACAAVTSERHFLVGGQPAGAQFASLSRFWQTADGWVRTHANYPWHRAALLATLGTPDDADAVGAALRERTSAGIEDAVFAAGGIAAAVRTSDEWRAHPQGAAVAFEPLVSHEVLGDASPRARPSTDGLPAAGRRVLDLTRVIAGPVCTRYLGALGADVLRVDAPDHPDLPPGAVADTLFAKRSTELDLRDAEDLGRVHELASRADVIVCGYRPGSLDRFGLGADDVAARHPGAVVVYLAAWGHTGPWAHRRGFDSVVQAPSGVARCESSDGATPGALPCQLLDHGTGYLAAAAALDGLRRQAQEGGTHIRRLSLARTARWLVTSGVSDGSAGGALDAAPWLVELPAGTDSVTAVAPPGAIGERPLRWPGPPARFRADPARWAADLT